MGDTRITEGNLTFCFKDSVAIKFDEEKFYRNHFNAMPESKGVDIVAVGKNDIQFIEIKDITNHASENMWRLVPANRAKHKNVSRKPASIGKNSYDIEVANKVAMSLACLVGAKTKGEMAENTEILIEILDKIQSDLIARNKKNIYVILFLEGEVTGYTRSKTIHMYQLSQNIKRYLKWFNCRVSVVDSETYNDRLFSVEKR